VVSASDPKQMFNPHIHTLHTLTHMGLIVTLKKANKLNICASAVFGNFVASLPQFYN
jgi:hypothetical protein